MVEFLDIYNRAFYVLKLTTALDPYDLSRVFVLAPTNDDATEDCYATQYPFRMAHNPRKRVYINITSKDIFNESIP